MMTVSFNKRTALVRDVDNLWKCKDWTKNVTFGTSISDIFLHVLSLFYWGGLVRPNVWVFSLHFPISTP